VISNEIHDWVPQVAFSTFLSLYSWLGFPQAIGVSFSLFFTVESLATEVTQVTNKNTRRASRFNELSSFNRKVVLTLFKCLGEI
jgi:hypothetical protein